jgi:predicted DNA-binding transcriptional regulator YafY
MTVTSVAAWSRCALPDYLRDFGNLFQSWWTSMLGIQTNLKRKIELLGLALDNTEGLRVDDFAIFFERDIPTIKRDLKDLRSEGIDIHSERSRGLQIGHDIDANLLRRIIIQYMGLCTAEGGVDRATRLMVKKVRRHSLSNLVRLQQCIEQRKVVRMDYQKDGRQREKDIEIRPLLIFSSEGYWRVLSFDETTMKQYHLNKVLHVRPTDRKFSRPPQDDIDRVFRHSFRSWIGTEEHHIKLHLDRTWAERVRPQQILETQELTEHPDGSVTFEATVNSLTEFASWVISRGKGVTVIEPEQLKKMVIETATGVLENYKR